MAFQESIEQAINILRQSGIILYPTDTIWGIGCDATLSEPVKKIYRLKKRKDQKSMLVLMDKPEMICDYIEVVPSIAWELIGVAEKPLTIIYPGAKNLAPNLINPDGSVGIRICKTKFCQELISRFKKPIVSTSANISGKNYPVNFKNLEKSILTQVDFIVKWGQEDITPGKPSSIIKLSINNEIEIIRK